MVDFTQSKSTLLSHQLVTHPNSVEGTAVSVATALSCLITMWHALVEATANTNPGTFRVFGSFDASADDQWFHILDIDVTTDTAATEDFTASEPVGEKVLAVASTTGFAAKDNIYLEDVNTIAQSEWHTVDKIVSNTSIDIMIGLVNQKDAPGTDDIIWGSAQQFRLPLPCDGLSRIRVDFSHEGGTGANAHIMAEVNVATDLE